MPKLGLDPDALGALQKQLRGDAATIKTLTSKLDGLLRSAWWEGPDATKFRGEWESAHKANLARVVAALETTAQLVAANVTQQQQASAS
jgi:uncharacterized protein YukE